uniref:Venom cystatin domain peptide Pr19a n=1 Tax=Platymeris rhadamanthus TaxID=1134088 RepID=A0A6B9L3S3_PLARH|nr:venom cystatin domain peptide Pr19a [Platymeris rhadamanthus]
MYTSKAIIVLFFAFMLHQIRADEPEEPINNLYDPRVLDLLNQVITQQKANVKLIEITKATTQLVNGITYRMEFEAKSFETNNIKKCKTVFTLRRIITILEFNC